jgi:hypothetical protein
VLVNAWQLKKNETMFFCAAVDAATCCSFSHQYCNLMFHPAIERAVWQSCKLQCSLLPGQGTQQQINSGTVARRSKRTDRSMSSGQQATTGKSFTTYCSGYQVGTAGSVLLMGLLVTRNS